MKSAAERPAYVFSAVFITLSELHLGAQLLDSAFFRRQYELAKGGHAMDFTRIAEDYLGVELQTVAVVFFLAALAPPVVAWLWNANRPTVARFQDRLSEPS